MGSVGSALADPTPTPSAVMLEIEIAAAKKRITKRRQAKYKPRNSYVSREKRVRDILETIFPGTSWDSAYPHWNLNPKTNRPMEIDCLCTRLRVCVEVDGTQHHKFSRHFHKTQREWDSQRFRDHVKDANCKRAGYQLIRVPPRDKLCDSRLALFLTTRLAQLRI